MEGSVLTFLQNDVVVERREFHSRETSISSKSGRMLELDVCSSISDRTSAGMVMEEDIRAAVVRVKRKEEVQKNVKKAAIRSS